MHVLNFSKTEYLSHVLNFSKTEYLSGNQYIILYTIVLYGYIYISKYTFGVFVKAYLHQIIVFYWHIVN